VSRIVEAAPSCGIGTLTLYAFSSDNWQRPTREVAMLMRLFRRYLISEVARCVTNGVRMTIIGRRDRLAPELLQAVRAAEDATRNGRVLDLRIALDYSARDTIMRAAHSVSGAEALTRETFMDLMATVNHDRTPAREVDLLIRTGGEQRLSDFLLWECAYAELYFTSRMWPDFAETDLAEAVADFRGRDRRFGRVPAVAAG
jgi:undecaprenyl diphosphate synthase